MPPEPKLENAAKSVDRIRTGLVTSSPLAVAPGTSGIEAMTHPSSPCSETIVKSITSLMAITGPHEPPTDLDGFE